jgi:hypothetical protein
MEYAGLKVIDENRCEFLRWKGLYVDTPHDPKLASGDRLFWCHKTGNCLGPDGRLADDDKCNTVRGCYRGI